MANVYLEVPFFSLSTPLASNCQPSPPASCFLPVTLIYTVHSPTTIATQPIVPVGAHLGYGSLSNCSQHGRQRQSISHHLVPDAVMSRPSVLHPSPAIATTATTNNTYNGVATVNRPCPLTDKLPNELRQQIYAYISFGRLDYPSLVTRNTWIRTASTCATPALHTPSLARTCRVLRADVLSCYLGDLQVELSDSSKFDGVFFERCLRALGTAVLHVRRLTVEHKVDVCLDEDYHDALRVRASTVFEVKDIDLTPPVTELRSGQHGPPELPTVSIACAFDPSMLLGEVKLPDPTTICTCSLESRLLEPEVHHKGASLNGSTPNAQLDTTSSQCLTAQRRLHPAIPDCPLTRGISSFLTRMGYESSNPKNETRPRRHSSGPLFTVPGQSIKLYESDASSSNTPVTRAASSSQHWPWPGCTTCHRRKWLLQGPVTWRHYGDKDDDDHVELVRTGNNVPGRIKYKGYSWILCPEDEVLSATEQEGNAVPYRYGMPFRCHWGPKRPALVRPYGQKSRRFL